MKEITPKAMRCNLGFCAAIFELTPEEARNEHGAIAIIGEHVIAASLGLEDRIGPREIVVVVPKGLLTPDAEEGE